MHRSSLLRHPLLRVGAIALALGLSVPALGAFATVWGISPAPVEPTALEQPGARSFIVTYTATITELPPTAHEASVWIPLARSRDGQQVLSRTIRCAYPYTIQPEPEFGNEVLHLLITAPLPDELAVAIEYTVDVHGQRITPQQPSPVMAVESLERDLGPERLMILDRKVRMMAKEATAGLKTPLERARGIYEYVIDYMRYDKHTPGWGRGDVKRACQLAAGNCTDFHSLFIALARASEIPARFKIGAQVPQHSDGAIAGYHCWAECYIEELGWVPVDASEAWKDPTKHAYYFGTLDPHKFLITVGRDLRLQPAPQAGPLNMLIAPYVEVDGRPFDGAAMELRFRNLESQQEAI